MKRTVYVTTPDGITHPYQTNRAYTHAVAVLYTDNPYRTSDWKIIGHHMTEKAANKRAVDYAPHYPHTTILPVLTEAPQGAVMLRKSKFTGWLNDACRQAEKDLKAARLEMGLSAQPEYTYYKGSDGKIRTQRWDEKWQMYLLVKE